MGWVLLVAGLIAAAGGVSAFAYAVVDPAFGRLHVTAATVAVVGGIGLIGLGTLIASLRRLAEAIETQAQHTWTAQMAGLRPPAAASIGTAAVAAALGEPLSPALPLRGEVVGPAGLARKESPEPRVAPPPSVEASAAPAGATADSLSVPAPELSDAAAAEPAEWPGADLSDPVHRSAEPSIGEPPAPLGIQPAPMPREEPVSLGFDAVEDRPPGREPPSGPQVLKSGVIEGMAYTLYSDGSVDAELPEGTRHFASIAEWRSYLREGV